MATKKITFAGLSQFCSSLITRTHATKAVSPVFRILINKGKLVNHQWRQFNLASVMATSTVVPKLDVAPVEDGNSATNGVEVAETPITAQEDSSPVEEAKEATESLVISTLAPENKVIFLRRRKMVLMMSYCGQGYLGMQKNPGMKTIEEDLFSCLLKSGYIDEESYKFPRVMHFQRAARTDKNVSAARQIVSMKMPDYIDIEKINSFLPPQVRVMAKRKVTKGFDSKSNCDARTYMYMIPTFAFTPLDQNVTEDYRISPEVLTELREILKVYLGTKNFHNFTSRRKATDPSSKRYIMSFTASEPFMKDGLEYLILRVKGQSFMLHQIRKMIGLVVAYMRGFAGKETFTKSWTLERIDIPKAPGVGLVLDQVHYDRYNQRYGSDGVHAALSWEDVDDKVEEFCQTYIYSIITKTENEEKSMFEWLITLPYHTYDVREVRTVVVAGDEDQVVNPNPLEFSRIGDAAVKVGYSIKGNKNEVDEEDDEEGPQSDDAASPRSEEKEKRVRAVDNDDDDDEEDNDIVRKEQKLAKKRRLV